MQSHTHSNGVVSQTSFIKTAFSDTSLLVWIQMGWYMNDSIHNIHNVYSRTPVRSEIWDIAHCQQREISPIRTATNVSLSSSHPPYPPLLSFSHSLSFSIPFFSAPTLKSGDWRGSGCTCKVAETRLEKSMCFWKSLRRFRPLHGALSFSLSFRPSCCLCPDSLHPLTSSLIYPLFYHFLSVSISLHLSLFEANICIRSAKIQRPISVNVMQGTSQSTQWQLDS